MWFSSKWSLDADAFVVGIGRNEPFLVYLRDKKRPFSFAGIWNKTVDEGTNEEVYSFGIITTTANSILAGLGMKRIPVILVERYEARWLKTTTPLSEITAMLEAFPDGLMNAYRISMKIDVPATPCSRCEVIPHLIHPAYPLPSTLLISNPLLFCMIIFHFDLKH